MELNRYCEAGDLAALQAYCAQANVTAAQIREYHALQIACLNNHLEVAHWLHQTFELTGADARIVDNCALQVACLVGHLEVARWLQRTFLLDAKDARANDNCALRWACAHGHFEVARWLQQTFHLTAADARADNNFALRMTCESGFLEVASWLQLTFQLTAADARAMDSYALRWACQNKHIEIIRWLQRTWGIPPDMILMAIACVPANSACAGYLRSLRPLTWSPRTHADFPLATRRLALLLLLVCQRLAREPGALPSLPPELWLHLLSFLPAW
mgnify:CR=1 FL=1